MGVKRFCAQQEIKDCDSTKEMEGNKKQKNLMMGQF